MALVRPKFLGRRTNWTLGNSPSHCALPSEEPLSMTMICRRSRPSEASRDSRQRRSSAERLCDTTTADMRGAAFSASVCCVAANSIEYRVHRERSRSAVIINSIREDFRGKGQKPQEGSQETQEEEVGSGPASHDRNGAGQ